LIQAATKNRAGNTTKPVTQPFDLQKALAHPDMVVTREGVPVRGLTYFNQLAPSIKETLYAVIMHNDLEERDIEAWQLDGAYYGDGRQSDNDLRLLDPDGPDAAGWYDRSVERWKTSELPFWVLHKDGITTGLVNASEAQFAAPWTKWQPIAAPKAAVAEPPEEDEDDEED
jgi:hypothetical protein